MATRFNNHSLGGFSYWTMSERKTLFFLDVFPKCHKFNIKDCIISEFLKLIYIKEATMVEKYPTDSSVVCKKKN